MSERLCSNLKSKKDIENINFFEKTKFGKKCFPYFFQHFFEIAKRTFIIKGKNLYCIPCVKNNPQIQQNLQHSSRPFKPSYHLNPITKNENSQVFTFNFKRHVYKPFFSRERPCILKLFSE